jgi:hypothetical protein
MVRVLLLVIGVVSSGCALVPTPSPNATSLMEVQCLDSPSAAICHQSIDAAVSALPSGELGLATARFEPSSCPDLVCTTSTPEPKTTYGIVTLTFVDGRSLVFVVRHTAQGYAASPLEGR